MTELEALRDLVSSPGWAYLTQRAAEDLRGWRDRALNAQSAEADELIDAGLRVARYQAAHQAVTSLLSWPQTRAVQIAKTEETS